MSSNDVCVDVRAPCWIEDVSGRLDQNENSEPSTRELLGNWMFKKLDVKCEIWCFCLVDKFDCLYWDIIH